MSITTTVHYHSTTTSSPPPLQIHASPAVLPTLPPLLLCQHRTQPPWHRFPSHTKVQRVKRRKEVVFSIKFPIQKKTFK